MGPSKSGRSGNAKQESYTRGAWTEAEDEVLRKAVEENGPQKWRTLAERIPGRIGKQCRERWYNHLDPSLKKEWWSLEEDLLIVRLHEEMGNSWSQMSKMVPGRTANSLKNRWNSTLKRKVERGEALTETSPPFHRPGQQLEGVHSVSSSSSAGHRRSASASGMLTAGPSRKLRVSPSMARSSSSCSNPSPVSSMGSSRPPRRRSASVSFASHYQDMDEDEEEEEDSDEVYEEEDEDEEGVNGKDEAEPFDMMDYQDVHAPQHMMFGMGFDVATGGEQVVVSQECGVLPPPHFVCEESTFGSPKPPSSYRNPLTLSLDTDESHDEDEASPQSASRFKWANKLMPMQPEDVPLSSIGAPLPHRGEGDAFQQEFPMNHHQQGELYLAAPSVHEDNVQRISPVEVHQPLMPASVRGLQAAAATMSAGAYFSAVPGRPPRHPMYQQQWNHQQQNHHPPQSGDGCRHQRAGSYPLSGRERRHCVMDQDMAAVSHHQYGGDNSRTCWQPQEEEEGGMHEVQNHQQYASFDGVYGRHGDAGPWGCWNGVEEDCGYTHGMEVQQRYEEEEDVIFHECEDLSPEDHKQYFGGRDDMICDENPHSTSNPVMMEGHSWVEQQHNPFWTGSMRMYSHQSEPQQVWHEDAVDCMDFDEEGNILFLDGHQTYAV